MRFAFAHLQTPIADPKHLTSLSNLSHSGFTAYGTARLYNLVGPLFSGLHANDMSGTKLRT